MRLTIESDVSVGSDSAKEQFDPASMLDLLLICDAFCFKIWCIAIQDVDVCGVDINM